MKSFRFLSSTLATALGLSLLTGLFAISPAKVEVAKAGGFDANTIISDALFTAKDSMSVADIQAFLEKKGSVLATISPSKLGDGANGRSAAQIIYDATRGSRTDFASSTYGPSNPLVISLNPQVMLVTLQKEQSLITGTYDPNSPGTTSALTWAIGYGCPDTSGCDSGYAGFTNQMVYGAAQFMYNYYRAANLEYKPGQTYTFGNTTGAPYYAPATQQVTIGNAATSSLYRYTPHVYNGNYNFWYYMNLWFTPTSYAPPLALDPADGTIYAIESAARYAVSSKGFAGWNFASGSVRSITPQQQALPIAGTFTHLALASDGTVYYMDNGTKRVITSARVFDRWNFNWKDVSAVPDAILDKVPFGLPAYELVLPTTGDGTIYLATNSVLYPIPGDVFNNGAQYSMKEVGRVPGYVVSGLTYGPNLSRLVYPTGGDGTVFVMDRGRGYRLSAAVAKEWNFDLSTIRKVGNSVTDELGAGGMFTTLAVQAGGDGTVYLVQGGKKRPISRSGWTNNGYSGNDVRTISAALLGTLPTGTPVN